jgi:hypothetical protein
LTSSHLQYDLFFLTVGPYDEPVVILPLAFGTQAKTYDVVEYQIYCLYECFVFLRDVLIVGIIFHRQGAQWKLLGPLVLPSPSFNFGGFTSAESTSALRDGAFVFRSPPSAFCKPLPLHRSYPPSSTTPRSPALVKLGRYGETVAFCIVYHFTDSTLSNIII